jgi:glycosyltransferase involved in cell wall biosynthesis
VMEWIAELERLGISFEVLAVNDGSRDGTGAALRRLAENHADRVTPLEKANAGHGRACRAGYAQAVERGAQWTLQIDSDGQCDPAFFAAFWKERSAGRGRRFCAGWT